MQSRKYLAITLFSLLMVVGISSTATAAVKAGQSCSKVGSISVSKNVKYTCVKSGKKLVWNKGVKIVPVVKPTPTPTPTKTPEVTSSPTPMPSTSLTPVITVQGKAMNEMKKSLAPI